MASVAARAPSHKASPIPARIAAQRVAPAPAPRAARGGSALGRTAWGPGPAQRRAVSARSYGANGGSYGGEDPLLSGMNVETNEQFDQVLRDALARGNQENEAKMEAARLLAQEQVKAHMASQQHVPLPDAAGPISAPDSAAHPASTPSPTWAPGVAPGVVKAMDNGMAQRAGQIAADSDESGLVEVLRFAVQGCQSNVQQWGAPTEAGEDLYLLSRKPRPATAAVEKLMRDHFDGMLEREEKQLQRMVFALEKAQKDAAYYKTIQRLYDERPRQPPPPPPPPSNEGFQWGGDASPPPPPSDEGFKWGGDASPPPPPSNEGFKWGQDPSPPPPPSETQW